MSTQLVTPEPTVTAELVVTTEPGVIPEAVVPPIAAPEPEPPVAAPESAPVAPAPSVGPPATGGLPGWVNALSKVYNPIVAALLRSPLHPLLSGRLLVLRFHGRKSGRPYSIPVSYDRQGAVLLIYTRHHWWKNLRGGAPVELVLRGRLVEAYAEAVTDPAEVVACVVAYLAVHGGDAAWQIDVRLDDRFPPSPEDIATAAAGLVVVRAHLPGVP